MLQVDEVNHEAGLLALRPEWEQLLSRCDDASPFQTFEWQATWWRHHGSGRLWLLTAREHGALCGALPLFVSSYRGTPIRRVAFVGSPHADYQGLIAAPDRAAACAQAFMEHLSRHRDRWDLLDLADLRKGTALTEIGPQQGLRTGLGHHRYCPFLQLPGTWDAFLQGLGRKLRANIRRRRRMMAKDFRAEYETAEAGRLHDAMEELFRLHNGRWRRRGVPGSFSGRRVQSFHHDLAQQFLSRGWLRLHLLRLNGETRAALYCFQYRDRVYYYLGGFDLSLSRYGLGTDIVAYAIEHAIRHGATQFDFMRGDEQYKYAWLAQDRETLRLVATGPSLRSRLAWHAHGLERFIEHEGLRLRSRFWGIERVQPADGEQPESQA